MTDKYNKRWYDKDTKLEKILEIMNGMSEANQEALCQNLINLVSAVRSAKKYKPEEEVVSIGKDRALGLYKAFSKRRWYDQENSLKLAMNKFSTLSIEDGNTVLDGILIYLGYKKSEINNI